jgi:hypothetical protein
LGFINNHYWLNRLDKVYRRFSAQSIHFFMDDVIVFIECSNIDYQYLQVRGCGELTKAVHVL